MIIYRSASIALLLAVLGPRSLPAQHTTRSAYLDSVDAYTRGEFERAASVLAHWSGPALATVAREFARRSSPARVEAAAMLHTDFALSLPAGARRPIEAQFEIALELVRSLPTPQSDRFKRQWYAVAAGFHTVLGDFNKAAAYARTGLAEFPHDSSLHVAAGVVQEVNANASLKSGGHTLVEKLLRAAENDYRHAVSDDGANLEARLHLGWVLHLESSDEHARQELQRAADGHSTVQVGYMAHLFLGALEEQDRNIEQAAAHYESARALAPQYQTAYVALSAAESALGRDGHARELAAAWAMLTPANEEDPWWNYHLGGFNASLLRSLRDMVIHQ